MFLKTSMLALAVSLSVASVAAFAQDAAKPAKTLTPQQQRMVDCNAQAKSKSQEIVAIGEKYKADAVEQAKVDAKAEADRIVAAAKAEIEQEVARAREQLRDSVADLAVAGASQILTRDVDRNVHAQLLAQLKSER